MAHVSATAEFDRTKAVNQEGLLRFVQGSTPTGTINPQGTLLISDTDREETFLTSAHFA